MKPSERPRNPLFSTGPCAKRPGWSVAVLADACVGRSHRSAEARAKLVEVLDRSRAILGLPSDYRVAIVPASDTGAMEMALWSMLGARGADMLAWESFGKSWAADAVKQLKLADARVIEADYGDLPDLSQVDFDRDVVFTWNGTTAGVRVPDGNWIAPDRKGLTICDATSAVFAMELPWDRLDVTTYSWQKVLGGEGQHGMLILSPRAVERLESYTPPWPVPKIFQLTKGGKLIQGLFEGQTINTPSMLCVEDVLDALRWAEQMGGVPGLVARSEGNLAAIATWVEKSDWAGFLAREPATRSCTSICLGITDGWFTGLDEARRRRVAKDIAGRLDEEGVARDIAAYRDAPPGLRVWGGATVERSDIEALLPWLDWAFAEIKAAAAVPV